MPHRDYWRQRPNCTYAQTLSATIYFLLTDISKINIYLDTLHIIGEMREIAVELKKKVLNPTLPTHAFIY